MRKYAILQRFLQKENQIIFFAFHTSVLLLKVDLQAAQIDSLQQKTKLCLCISIEKRYIQNKFFN
ncbi:hypothetical protein SPPR111872_21615 [Sphingobacterium prati]